MASNRTVATGYYEDRRVRDRRTQEISFDDIDDVRSRELAIVRVPSPSYQEQEPGPRSRYASDDYEVDRTVTRIVRERNFPDDRYLVPYMRERDVGYYDRRPSRRRDLNDDDSESDSSRERQRRRRHRRAHSDWEGRDRNRSAPAQTREQNGDEDDDGGYLWYSMKKRNEGSLLERHFDSSYDGIIAGVAGAAIGAITARRFGGEKNSKIKVLGGAVVGAVGFNMAENHYRVFTEEREERKEKKEARAEARQEAQRQDH